MLKRAVALDPAYAPAWSALAQAGVLRREYSDGGNAAFERARADRREGHADRSQLHGSRREPGDPAAWKAATSRAPWRRRRDSPACGPTAPAPISRSPMSCVTPGRHEESAARMRRGPGARPEGPGLAFLRLTFMLLGNYDRAMDYTRLDAGSQWATLVGSQPAPAPGQAGRDASRCSERSTEANGRPDHGGMPRRSALSEAIPRSARAGAEVSARTATRSRNTSRRGGWPTAATREWPCACCGERSRAITSPCPAMDRDPLSRRSEACRVRLDPRPRNREDRSSSPRAARTAAR